MVDNLQETRWREHLRMLREAARGMTVDLETDFKKVEQDMARAPRVAERDAAKIRQDIDYHLFLIGVKLHKARKAFPGKVKGAGKAIGRGAKSLASSTVKDAKKAKRGVKNELALAAGVRHAPMSEWSHPTEKNQ